MKKNKKNNNANNEPTGKKGYAKYLLFGFLALIVLAVVTYASTTFNTNSGTISNTLINDSGMYYNDGSSYRGVSSGIADVVLCRGTSTADNIYKSIKWASGCDVVCLSTDANCADDFTTAFNKLTSGRTYKQTVIAKGIFPVTAKITVPSYTNLYVEQVNASGTYTNIFESTNRRDVSIFFQYLDTSAFINSTATSIGFDWEYGTNYYVGGWNGMGIINNTNGGLTRGVSTYCLITAPCYNMKIENIIILDSMSTGIKCSDYSNCDVNNIIIDSGNATSWKRLRYGFETSRNIRTSANKLTVLYPRIGGIYDAGNTKGLTITNSKFYFNGTDNVDQDGMEIGVSSASYGETENVIISNNLIDGIKNNAILIYPNVTNSLITDNFIINSNISSNQYQVAMQTVGDKNNYIDNMIYTGSIETKFCTNSSVWNGRLIQNGTNIGICNGHIGWVIK